MEKDADIGSARVFFAEFFGAEALPLPIARTPDGKEKEDVGTGPSGSIALCVRPTGAATRFGCIPLPQVGFAIMHSWRLRKLPSVEPNNSDTCCASARWLFRTQLIDLGH